MKVYCSIHPKIIYRDILYDFKKNDTDEWPSCDMEVDVAKILLRIGPSDYWTGEGGPPKGARLAPGIFQTEPSRPKGMTISEISTLPSTQVGISKEAVLYKTYQADMEVHGLKKPTLEVKSVNQFIPRKETIIKEKPISGDIPEGVLLTPDEDYIDTYEKVIINPEITKPSQYIDPTRINCRELMSIVSNLTNPTDISRMIDKEKKRSGNQKPRKTVIELLSRQLGIIRENSEII